jgi:hypothetical protein
VAISVVVALVVHWRERRLLRAVLMSSVLATVLFQVAAYVHLGHIDPFFPIAVVVGGVSSAVISAVVGGAFMLGRRGGGTS